MTETLFTPGPWRVEQGTTLVWGACNADDPTSRGMGYPIADARTTAPGTWAKGHPHEAEGIANAHLIAASPDLYEALEALADAADVVGVEYFDTDTMSLEVEAMQSATLAARAALSRARGESSNV